MANALGTLHYAEKFPTSLTYSGNKNDLTKLINSYDDGIRKICEYLALEEVQANAALRNENLKKFGHMEMKKNILLFVRDHGSFDPVKNKSDVCNSSSKTDQEIYEKVVLDTANQLQHSGSPTLLTPKSNYRSLDELRAIAEGALKSASNT